MPPTLVRPQTFTVLQQSDPASPAVRLESSSCESCSSTETAKTALSRILTSWFEYFTCSNTREQNLIYSLVEVRGLESADSASQRRNAPAFKYLVFVLKDLVEPLKPMIFKDFDKSNSGGYTSSCFPLIGKTESLQQEER